MIAWKIKNIFSGKYLKGWIDYHLALAAGKTMGVMSFVGKTSIVVTHPDGSIDDYGVVGYRVVTTEFVNHLVAELITADATFNAYKYHGLGTGTGNEAVGDTALTETTDGSPARGIGSQEVGASNNIYKSISAAITMDATVAITEHGLFNTVYGGADKLMDRTKFTVINAESGDTITPTYQLTCTAGS